MVLKRENGCRFDVIAMAFSVLLSIRFVDQCDCSGLLPSKGSSRSLQYSHSGYAAATNSFDVRSFGAIGNGKTDDTEAFQAAWNAVCSNQGPPQTILSIPAGWTFLVGPITFTGPCYSSVVMKLEGAILSATNPGKWSSMKLFQWIDIIKVHNFALTGSGVIDGQGQPWWKSGSKYDDEESYGSVSLSLGVKPTAVRFYGSIDVRVEGIKISNSPLCHLKFDNCIGVNVTGIAVTSPEDSPNTDGIHLQDSQDVEIQHSTFACGDDCVSIQTGCSNLRIHHLVCGPSHGISIGSLGQGGTRACVSNVSVHDCTIQHSLNGVRIKTWQGGGGVVNGIIFEAIELLEVWTGINVDQYYCGNSRCGNKTSGIEIKGVTFQKFRGSFVNKALSLACSDVYPCTEIKLIDIELQPSATAFSSSRNSSHYCWNSYGSYQGPILPMDSLDCLHSGKPNNLSHAQTNLDLC